jgi:RNA-dependent RNA polymerase
MVLEDRGVPAENFLELQEYAVADAWRIDDSIEEFRTILKGHGLGNGYRLAHTMQRLNELGLDLKHQDTSKVVDNPFLARVRKFAKNHVLRDIKHGARIPVPNSWLLVGVADEGPAYQRDGLENVYCLLPGKIYGALFALLCPQPLRADLYLLSLRPESRR